jgi:hypothetical protein
VQASIDPAKVLGIPVTVPWLRRFRPTPLVGEF